MVSRRPVHKVSRSSLKCSEKKDGSVAFLQCVEQSVCKDTICNPGAADAVDRSTELSVPNIDTEISPVVCSDDTCASTSPWGCVDHARYSKELLLAHHAWSLRIASGPPGLTPCREPQPTPTLPKSSGVSRVIMPSMGTPPGLVPCDEVKASATPGKSKTKVVDATLGCPPGLAFHPHPLRPSVCSRSVAANSASPSKAYTVNHLVSMQPVVEDCSFRVIGPACLTVKVDTVRAAYVVASKGAEAAKFQWSSARGGAGVAWSAMCSHITTRSLARSDAQLRCSLREEV